MKELKLEDILANSTEITQKKTGYVAIIGRPNTGKSTFLNHIIGQKVSIVSGVPQTTRKRVLGIYNDTDSQIIFFDTPGIHESAKLFNEKINSQAISSLKEADIILYMIDSSRPRGEEEKYIEDILKDINIPLITTITKSDLNPKIDLTTLKYNHKISTVNKEGIEELLEDIKSRLQIGPTYYPEDYYTTQNMYFRISEIIREKVFLNTKEELPHSVYIKVEEIEDKEDILRIVAYAYTETDSQKYIIIGKNGSLISKIGKEARIELEKIFEKKVFLALRAKTKPKWRKDERFIDSLLK